MSQSSTPSSSAHTPAALESAAPLKQALADQAAQAKKALNQTGFERSDYQRLLALADRTVERLAKFGLSTDGKGRLERLRRVLNDLIALMENPEADVVRPSESEVYLTGLELGQLAHIVGALVQSKGRWNQRVMDVVMGDASLPAGALASQRFKLQFAAMCAQAGFRIDPPEASMQSDMALDLSGWRIGVAAETIPHDATVDGAVERCVEHLRHDRIPGVIVLEITSLAWPERRVVRVASDAVAVHELQRRADGFLVSHRDRIAGRIDPAFAFGLLAVATLPTYNVATRHVAFTTSFRIASLCPDTDPRMQKLTEFARRFQKIGA